MRNRLIRVLAVLTLFIAIYWLWHSVDTSQFAFGAMFEPTLSVLGAISTIAAIFWPEKSSQVEVKISDSRLVEDRRSLIGALDFLFEERLSQTLEDDLRAQLNLDYTPQAAQDRRWLNRDGLPGDLLADEDITKIFHAAKRKLLILGKPGAGKTTTLYRLGTQLLKEATPENAVPLPIVFELSRWAQNPDVSLRDWLAAEMKDRFGSTIENWQSWLESTAPRIIPLLDGFDEVPEDKRQKCAGLINEFARYETVPLVVCSRIDEYALLEEKLAINAVEIQELTEEQINTYMQFLDTDIDLRTILRGRPELMNLAKQPLFLNILALTDFTEDDVGSILDVDSLSSFKLAGSTTVELTQRIFSRFIDSRFEIDPAQNDPPHTQEETLKWLRWLAWQMEKHNKMQQFEIEGLQPDWLGDEELVKGHKWHVQMISRMLIGIVSGLFIGIAAGVIFGLLGGLKIGVGFGIFLGLSGGLINGLYLKIDRLMIDEIEPVEQLQWSWTATSRLWSSLPRSMLTFGLLGGLAFGLLGTTFGGINGRLIFGLIGGATYALILNVSIGLSLGFTRYQIDFKQTTNEGILYSFRNSIQILLFGWLSVALLFGLIVGLLSDFIFGFRGGVYAGLASIIIYVNLFEPDIGLRYGGLAVIQHIVLREMLYRQGVMPRNYARFLDYCVRLRLLVRVGGSYKFLHRLLQEHFAAEYENTTS